MRDDAEVPLLADKLVRDRNIRDAVIAFAGLVGDGVDLGPVATSMGIQGDAVEPGRPGVSETSADDIAIDMEIGDVYVLNIRGVATTRHLPLVFVYERTGSRRMLDKEVGANADCEEQHSGDERDHGRHADC